MEVDDRRVLNWLLLADIPASVVSVAHPRGRRRNTGPLGRLIVRFPVGFHHLDGAHAVLTNRSLVLIVCVALGGGILVPGRRIGHVPVTVEVLMAVRVGRGKVEASLIVPLLVGLALLLLLILLLLLLLATGAVEDRVAVEIEALILEGADDASILGFVISIGQFEVGICVATGLRHGLPVLRSLVGLDVGPGELVDLLATKGSTRLLGGHEVIESPLRRMTRHCTSRHGLLLDLPATVVGSNVEVTEPVRIGPVSGLLASLLSRNRFVVIEQTVVLEVPSRAYFGRNGASRFRRGRIGLISAVVITHEQLTKITWRRLRSRSGTRGANRLRAVITRRQEISQRFGRIGVPDASPASWGPRSIGVVGVLLLLGVGGLLLRRSSDIGGRGCDRRLNQSSLVFGVTDGPTATPTANNLDLSQQRRLVPVDANILNLSIAVETNDMDL